MVSCSFSWPHRIAGWCWWIFARHFLGRCMFDVWPDAWMLKQRMLQLISAALRRIFGRGIWTNTRARTSLWSQWGLFFLLKKNRCHGWNMGMSSIHKYPQMGVHRPMKRKPNDGRLTLFQHAVWWRWHIWDGHSIPWQFPPSFPSHGVMPTFFFGGYLGIARSQWWRSAEASLVGYIGPTWVMWGSESLGFIRRSQAPRGTRQIGDLCWSCPQSQQHTTAATSDTSCWGTLERECLGIFVFFFWAPFFNDFCDQEVSVSISSMAPQVSFFQTQQQKTNSSLNIYIFNYIWYIDRYIYSPIQLIPALGDLGVQLLPWECELQHWPKSADAAWLSDFAWEGEQSSPREEGEVGAHVFQRQDLRDPEISERSGPRGSLFFRWVGV